MNAPSETPQRKPHLLVLASYFKGEKFLQQAHARGADVTLLTAMLARLSRNAADGQAAQPSATIGALLARCEARSTEDPAGAIKCRQELCANDRASLAACLTPPNGRAR